MKKIIFTLFFLLFVSLSGYAEEKPQAMLVFDASGSMWGKINGKTKISIAKQALNKVLTDWNEDLHLGLIAYGHRKKGDCDDIQTLVSIGSLDKDSMIAKVKAIKPKGKTPISRSIKKAAEELRYTEEKATIILISDGKETCDADPCETAKALKNEGIDFIAHVIGFDVDKNTDKQLKCIADVTGGEYFSAKNASSLNNAMGKIAEKVQEEAPKPKPTVIKNPKKNLEIIASETEGGKWIRAYHIIRRITDGEVESKRTAGCYSKKRTACLEKIPVGKYTIHSTYNKFKKDTTFEIKAGEITKLHIAMGQTGKVEITASEKEGGKWVRAYHTIYAINDGEVEEGRIAGCYSKKKRACLEQIPVGKYTIHSTFNKFKKETPFEVKAGETTQVNIVMGQTGKVKITASKKQGGKWIKAYHTIHKITDGEVDEGRIAGCYSKKKAACLEQLPVGEYTIRSTFNRFKKDTPFEIQAGKTTELHILFSQFVIKTKCSNRNAQVIHEIYASNGQLLFEEKTSCSKAVNAVLENGAYTLTTTLDNQSKDTKFSVDADSAHQITIDMQEPSHQDLIDADKKEQSVKNEEKSAGKTTTEAQTKPDKQVQIEQQPLEAIKKSLKAAIPNYQAVIVCYQKANDLSDIKQCESREKEIVQLVAKEFQQATKAKTSNNAELKQHSEWNNEIKQQTVAQKQSELNNMKLTLGCFEQGINFSGLADCIKNNNK